MPKALNKSMADGVYRFSDANADIAVFKEGASYHIYDYASGNISRTLLSRTGAEHTRFSKTSFPWELRRIFLKYRIFFKKFDSLHEKSVL